MRLRHKEDWDQAKRRFEAWWAHDAIGRCGLAVTAPRSDAPDEPPPEMPADPVARWTDLEYISRLGHYRRSRTFYGGEAFPVWDYGYPGNKQLAVFLGCPITLDHRTGWVDPIFDGEDIDWQSMQIDESNRWWQFTLAWLNRAASESPGVCIPAVGAFGGSGDTLAAMRSTEKLLYDVMDRPDQVRAADQHLMKLWCQAYQRFYDITAQAADGGSTCWFKLWAPGKFYAAQNDFSYMISPKMFQDLFLPSIEMQTEFLDYAVFHVDGIGAFAHVDALCDLPRLQAIQILPGAGKPSPLHYLSVLRTVQERGKNLHITIPPDEVEEALSLLSARGLFIATSCTTQEEAETLLRNAERWSIDRSPHP